ncbi:hypothetical protein CCR83_02045 [Rhodobacter veldkampii DSM 11550]|uniref:Lipoprotein n=1 Tax=Phaeovulum veldkampii DSM 11550 TaxID=1185920 RepID=A0A2T4JGZ8_9RHOB|nr:hypothetical protein [Phaeovulum veldkampii]MBK5945258.1 hypothetical protein [Phaeovulum veldkampii DSM 11550]PTE17189.1 hypothetical protein C5F46_10440 [Phaeovulum veldkampii DSM 11550]TDQ61446.1 hypothetical protein EV658_104160 [Phaeovulum veldkampii DSM 11550]
MRPATVFVLLAAVAACGPIPVERAEDECFRQARLASQPRGMVGIGAGSGGLVSKIEVEITSDYLRGRDPSEVYARCVYQKSGQLPTRPLYSRDDWKG